MKMADVDDKGAAIIVQTLQKLRRLPVPPGDSAALSAIYAKVDALATDTRQLASALRSGDPATVQRVAARVNADADAANSASQEYGLTVCGS
jgi:hypothetical protein